MKYSGKKRNYLNFCSMCIVFCMKLHEYATSCLFWSPPPPKDWVKESIFERNVVVFFPIKAICICCNLLPRSILHCSYFALCIALLVWLPFQSNSLAEGYLTFQCDLETCTICWKQNKQIVVETSKYTCNVTVQNVKFI